MMRPPLYLPAPKNPVKRHPVPNTSLRVFYAYLPEIIGLFHSDAREIIRFFDSKFYKRAARTRKQTIPGTPAGTFIFRKLVII